MSFLSGVGNFLLNDPTPGFGLVNTARTQLANATGQQIPGLNTTTSQKAEDQARQLGGNVNPSGVAYTINGVQYNAGGDPLGRVKGVETTSGYGTGGGGGGSVSSSSVDPAYVDFVNRSYDTQVGGLKNILGTLSPAENAAKLQLNNQYNTNANRLKTQHEQGVRNLDFSTNQINDQRARSLKDIGDSVLNSSMNYNNQLGAFGAANSSAAGQIQRALAGMAAKNRGNVMDSASDQLTQVGYQRNDLEDAFSNNMKDLDNWKNSTYNDLVNQYAAQRLNIQQQIAGAEGQRAAYLAEQGRRLDQSVLDGLSALKNQYKTYAQGLVNRYRNPVAPQVGIAPELQQFAVNPISAGQLGQINTDPLQNVNQSDATSFLFKKPDEELGIV